MGRIDLAAAKRAYRTAKEVGNRSEEARWANNVGDILKNNGEYVEALKWFRIDYDISVKCLPGKDLLPTCQSLGEIYLRLQDFKEALIYQKKHLELAEEANDTVEKQRACTQLGRTYHELFLKSQDDCDAIQSAKKYFKKAMELAQVLKEKPPPGDSSSFLEEYINAHNNIGMLDLDLDNPDAACTILMKGLKICDEEEVNEYDAMRSRLHHNLGNVFLELRSWEEAKEHIKMDIEICHKINHCQGEAKGYINLAELHNKTQNYRDALSCYGKASTLAKSMQDESALVEQIEDNIKIVKEAIKVMEKLREEERMLKKLSAEMTDAKGTSEERKSMLQVHACLERLIEKSSIVFAWEKHLEYSKRKKKISDELCDKGKLNDAFLVVGESYQKLRKFRKSLKWVGRSYDGYKAIGNLEGQALAKINIGDGLDCIGEWTQALKEFENGYRIALKANIPSVQLSALEHMHYSHMIRFGNAKQARELKEKIHNLESEHGERAQCGTEDECSETDSEGHGNISNDRPNECSSPDLQTSNSLRSKPLADLDEANDDVPLISFLQPGKRLSKRKNFSGKQNVETDQAKKDFSALTGSQQTVSGRKRIRVILSDDESETEYELGCPRGSFHKVISQSKEVSDESMYFDGAVNCTDNPAIQDHVEEGSSSYTSFRPTKVAPDVNNCRPLTKNIESTGCGIKGSQCEAGESNGTQCNNGASLVNFHAYSKTEDQKIKIEIEHLHMDLDSCSGNDESVKVELTCLYYLQLPGDEKSKGLLPIIHHLEYGGRVLKPLDLYEILTDSSENVVIEASVSGWVHKRLMKLYMDCCQNLLEKPSMKLLKKLYISEVEDDINVSECELQDVSAAPLLRALHVHNTVAMLDLSHNMLGNGTMEKLKQLFASSNQMYGALTLDLHCNRFGPTALFQICECPVLFTRLEVLNVSRNRLTDACGSYLSTILKNCRALYSLNVEHCSLTSRTVQKIANALDPESGLSQLYIGYNNPVSGSAIQNLFAKIATLSSFAELSMNGIKLSSQVVSSLSALVKTPSLSKLLVGSSGIGTDGAIKITESLCYQKEETVKLDLSCCGLASPFFLKIIQDITLTSSILELNVGGNPITEEGTSALGMLLTNPCSNIKVLILNKCHLKLSGILCIVQALSDNKNLEELNISENAKMDETMFGEPVKASSEVEPKEYGSCESITAMDKTHCVETKHPCQNSEKEQELCEASMECDDLEVADSEDEQIEEQTATSSSLSLPRKNHIIKELSTALAVANQLQILDLSNNGFSVDALETLYMAWSSSGSRTGIAQRHVKDEIVHFYVEGKMCCGLKSCCRKD